MAVRAKVRSGKLLKVRLHRRQQTLRPPQARCLPHPEEAQRAVSKDALKFSLETVEPPDPIHILYWGINIFMRI